MLAFLHLSVFWVVLLFFVYLLHTLYQFREHIILSALGDYPI